MRGLAVLLLGMVLGLSGCVVYDDDHDHGYRGGYPHWDGGDRHHRHWEGRDYRRDHWEGRRDGRRYHRDHDD